MAKSHDIDALNIVMAASEAVPYVKTGGLADVAGALPVELAKLGHRVTLIVPRYRGFQTEGRSLREIGTIRVRTAAGFVDATLEEDVISVGKAGRSVHVVAVRYDPYFDRAGLYQGPDGDFSDNLARFAFFSRAIIEVLAFLGSRRREPISILHLHDWQTALAAVYLKTAEYDRATIGDIRTLLTLHNVGYQGIFPGSQFFEAGLPADLFTPAGLEFYGSVNLLKGGILFADKVSTVSPTYAKEIMSPDGGFGLEGVLASRRDGVIGIINGIDVVSWNPKTDSYLAANYSRTDLSGKAVCKRALQLELGLPNCDVPLIGVIGRLTPQKGFDLLAEIIPELMAEGVQVAILGTGDRILEDRFHSLRERYPQQIGVALKFDEGRAHRIEAGADMLVMPSRYEPCGLTQLYSLRYGTIPIVRKTGGLADTVIPYRPSTALEGRATGFQFSEASADSLLATILLALKMYRDGEIWTSIQQAGMEVDYSWKHSATLYVEEYKRLHAR
ncbi:MAG: glycogen synthase GlgA [Nitrospira sp.]|nr:glycogen synthase GlgA [Nitrospira sp.]